MTMRELVPTPEDRALANEVLDRAINLWKHKPPNPGLPAVSAWMVEIEIAIANARVNAHNAALDKAIEECGACSNPLQCERAIRGLKLES